MNFMELTRAPLLPVQVLRFSPPKFASRLESYYKFVEYLTGPFQLNRWPELESTYPGQKALEA
jgi:hypothetical protein